MKNDGSCDLILNFYDLSSNFSGILKKVGKVKIGKK